MKTLALVGILSLVLGSPALAEETNSYGEPIWRNIASDIEMILLEGNQCISELGWRFERVGDTWQKANGAVALEDSPETQRAVGRCLGVYNAAMVLSAYGIPADVHDQLVGRYLVTLQPTLIGYANCLAEDCDQLQEFVDRDVHGMGVSLQWVIRNYINPPPCPEPTEISCPGLADLS